MKSLQGIRRWLRANRSLVLITIVISLVAVVEYTVVAVATQWYGEELELRQFAATSLFLVGGSFLYGAGRAFGNNPAYVEPYRDWLKTTPWVPRKSLPLGAVHLTVTDLLALGIGMWAWPLPWASWAVPLAFLIPYNSLLGYSSFRARRDRATFLSLLLTALLPLSITFSILARIDWPVLLCLAAMTTSVQWGWLATMSHFPWKGLPLEHGPQFLISKQGYQENPSGFWPRVHPWKEVQIENQVSRGQVAMIAFLWGWIPAIAILTLQAYVHYSSEPAHGILEIPTQLLSLLLAVGAIATLAFLRLARYTYRCYPPMGIWTRLRTGQWSHPSYDCVYLTPLCILILGGVICGVLYWLNVPPALTAFFTTSLPAAMAFGIGPSLAEWRLTGGYRMSTSPPSSNSRNESSTPSAANRS